MIYLACDHAGFYLKEKVKEHLRAQGYELGDSGAYQFLEHDDYPDFIKNAAQKVSLNPKNTRAIIFGGSGQAEAMVANKYPHVRCAVFYGIAMPTQAVNTDGNQSDNPLTIVRLTREHNNANILSIGARFVTENIAFAAISLWLDTPFSNDERHIRRLTKLAKLEEHLYK